MSTNTQYVTEDDLYLFQVNARTVAMPVEMAFDWSPEDFAAVSAGVWDCAKDYIWDIQTCKVEILKGGHNRALAVITWDGDNNLATNPLAFRGLETRIAGFLTWAGGPEKTEE